MSPDAIRVPLRKRFNPDQLRAVALAYRVKMAEGFGDTEASKAAREAFVAHGGCLTDAVREAALMIAAVTMQDGDWFWRPVKAYHQREEVALRVAGQWPGPLPTEERRRVAAEAMRKIDTATGAAGAGGQS